MGQFPPFNDVVRGFGTSQVFIAMLDFICGFIGQPIIPYLIYVFVAILP